MVITVDAELASALAETARKQGAIPEELALAALRQRFLPAPDIVPQDEWERKLFSVATNCGVSLSDEALSSDGLYD